MSMQNLVKLFAVSAVLLFKITCFGNQFPSWVQLQSKLQAFEQLAEWSTETQPYEIQNTTILEQKNAGGELIQKVEISLQSSNCEKQKLSTTCLPVGLHTPSPALFCNMTLVGCGGKTISKMKLVK